MARLIARQVLGVLTLATSGIAASVACNQIIGVKDAVYEDAGAGPGDSDDASGDFDARTGPDVLAPPENVFEIALGAAHSCVRFPNNGTIKCWGGYLVGNNQFIDAGVKPQAIQNVTNAIALAAGGGRSCAILQDRTVSCWGDNGGAIPTRQANVQDAVRIAVGASFSCSLTSSGQVQCWPQQPIPAGLAASAIAVGDQHACAIRQDGVVVCWPNGSTALGIVTGATSIACGNNFSCAVKAGIVYCWGTNDQAQLGQGTINPSFSATPLPVKGVSDAVSVIAGRAHACAVTGSGDVWCWGFGRDGELGVQATYHVDAPSGAVKVDVGGKASRIGAGVQHSCVTKLDNNVACWGANDLGQLGNPQAGDASATPVQVTF